MQRRRIRAATDRLTRTPRHSRQKYRVTHRYRKETVQWQDRTHFFAISANVMRRILVQFARSRGSRKRGGGAGQVDLDEALIPSPERDADLIALDDALTALAAIDPREAKVVELRFFGGMSVEETAEVLQLSGMTVKRDWNHAKAWLLQQLKRGTGG